MTYLLKTKLWDYGLDSTQEERAQRLHEESIIVDMLFQGPVGAAVFTDEMSKHVVADYERDHDAYRNMFWTMRLPTRMAVRGELPEYKAWWDASGITAGSRGLADRSMADVLWDLAMQTFQFDHFDWLLKALCAEDIRRAKVDGKHAGFLSLQNTVALGRDLDNLNLLHEFGLSMLQLTYNSMNFVGAGCTERTDAGLSSYGAKFIERMNELGIIVDTGHCGRQTTLDACEVSRSPVVASHTSAERISGRARSKSDEELEAIAGSGGVIGIVACPEFLSAEPGATIEDFLDHIDYVVNLVGCGHVGIGTDWPLQMDEWSSRKLVEEVAPETGFRPEDEISDEMLIGFDDYREFINITRGLVSRGYSDKEIADILGENFLRVFEQVCG